ncbi:MAG TPA: polyphosphate kinase 2 family protein [Candidatus Polarisedimenticolia bacterium]|jgi:PPK2 family polyphosphate:nucleotide phosphotransferase|nr:polyphosphate kinase 2 family protein [Candidatus Polarisedimenticolia bacterium]
MKTPQVKKAARLAERFRVEDGDSFRLDDVDPADTLGYRKEQVAGLLQRGIERLSELQEKLYAQDRWALLCIFQAMDAAGKDSTIEHVMSGVNPQGVDVRSFKAPSSEELDHDFLWRTSRCLPERGRIGIFNRSYYEEVLVVRVHPEILDAQHLPDAVRSKSLFDDRFEDIRAFERYLGRNGVGVAKFYLHVSKKEQRSRFLARLERPEKNWKFSAADLKERGYWKDYMRAYEDAIRRTATKRAPWYVIPADHKWFTRLVVAAALIATLEELDLHFPKVDKAKRRELRTVREKIEQERD